MFRLATPLASAQPISDFDDISTIITHSSLTSSRKTAPWQQFVQDNGHVFYVELTKPGHTHTPSTSSTSSASSKTDARSVCSLCSTRSCHSCASEDTGYSSDADAQSTQSRPRRWERSLLDCSHDSLSLQSRAVDFEDDDDGVSVDLVLDLDHPHTPRSGPQWDGDRDLCEMTRRCQVRSRSHDEPHACSSGCARTSSLCKRHYSYKVRSSELNRSKATELPRPCRCGGGLDSAGSKQNQQKNQKDVVLRVSPSQPFWDGRSNVSWLECVLGVVPGRVVDSQLPQGRHKELKDCDKVIIKGLVPGGPAAKSKDLLVGEQLVSINGRQVTWKNLEVVLSSLHTSRKVRLTVTHPHSPTPPPPTAITSTNSATTSGHLLHDTSAVLRFLTGNNNSININDNDDDFDDLGIPTSASTSISTILGSRSLVDDLEGVCVLYMSLPAGGEEGGKEDEDVVFEFPGGRRGGRGSVPLPGGVCQSSVGHRLRGCFFTLHHLLEGGAADSDIRMLRVGADDTLINVACRKEGRDMLIVTAPAHRMESSQLLTMTKDIVRLVRLLYGSVEQAFGCENHLALHHFLACLLTGLHMQRLPALKGMHSGSLTSLADYMDFLPLPDDVLVSISSTITEYESADFLHSSENGADSRRLFTILGSMVLYKGQVTCCHLPTEDAKDVWTYLQHSGLRQLSVTTTAAAIPPTATSQQQWHHVGQGLQQVLVWREVFPTRLCHEVSAINSVFGYSEPHARWFLLVVGLKNTLLACVLEAGGCSTQHEGACSPDPLYVDQARAALVHLQAADIICACEIRLNGEGLPPTTTADSKCLSLISGSGSQQSFPSQGSTPRGMNPIPHLHLTKNSASHSSPLSSASSSPRSFGPPGSGHAVSAGVVNSGSRSSKVSQGLVPLSVTGNLRRVGESGLCSMEEDGDGWSRSSGGSGSVESGGKNSPLFRPSSHSPALQIGTGVIVNSDINTCKVNAGKDNALFVFCQVNQQEGVVITSPNAQIGNQGAGCSLALHRHVTHNFHRCVAQIHASFTQILTPKRYPNEGVLEDFEGDYSLSGSREEGVMFTCPLADRTDGKKQAQGLVYWVIGRKFRYPLCREIYVCFHESTPQTAIDLAFRLSLGSLSSA